MEKIFEPIRNFYGRFERPISSLSLIAGFVFDALTLKRLDTLWENFWILGHLVIIGVFIFLIHLHENMPGDEENPHKAHFWYVNILQFFFGGILSAYLVFYFRSADILVAWPFIALLVIAFAANESLKRYYVRLSFQLSLFFLSIYLFCIYLAPVVLHKITTITFLISGLVSILVFAVFTATLFYFIKNKFHENHHESKRLIIFLIAGIFVVVNVLYFTNLIPPIPLSLKDAGMYHSVEKNSAGGYNLTYEDHGWKSYFELFPSFTESPGEPVYAFSAIYSPKSLDLTIVHEWQYFNANSTRWETKSVITLPVVGGRDGGFRTYSKRYDLEPGKWRVVIKTSHGLTIGHIRFNIVNSETPAELSTMVK